jgi:drug/metabolite transporter (DMT)-like permease
MAGYVKDATPRTRQAPERRLFAIGLRLVAASAFSIMAALIKLASDQGVSVPETLFWRQAGAAPLILIWVILGPGLASLKTQNFRLHIDRSMLGLVSMSFMFVGFSILPLAEATAIGFTMPIFATILSWFILKESIGKHRITAIAAGFMGALIIIQPGDGHIMLSGAMAMVLASILSALVSIRLREMGQTEAPGTISFWFSILSLIPLGLLMPFYASNHGSTAWLILAAIGACGAVGQIAMTSSLRHAPVSVVIGMDYVALIWSTIFGYYIWDELPANSTWIGAPIIIFSSLYIAWREHKLSLKRSQDLAM